jgi:hypothetical protein
MEGAIAGRAIITDNWNEQQIVIAARRNWFALLFIPVWLCGWLLGEVFVLIAVLNLALAGSALALILLLWLTFWTYGGFRAVQGLLWNIKGREVITLGSGLLTIDRRFQPLYRRREYELSEVSGLRVHNPWAFTLFSDGWKHIGGAGKEGSIRFEWGTKTISFGEGLRRAEAESLLQELRGTRFLSPVNFA